MNNILSRILKKRGRLISNFISLSFLEMINYIIPILLIPFIIRIFGVSKFGEYMFAQSFMQYFVIFVDFGFNFYATREISKNKNDKLIISNIFSSVITVKIFLFLMSLLILLFCIYYLPFFEDKSLILLVFGLVLGNTLLPVYVFQGLELMKPLVIINIVPKLFFIILIFFLIKGNQDFHFFVLLMSLGSVFSGFIGLLYLMYNNIVIFKNVNKNELKFAFLNSKNIFLANSASALYLNTNSFILGLVTNFTVVGYYSVAEKIVRVTRYVMNPLSQTLFPYLSDKFSKQTILHSKQNIITLLKKISPLLILIILLLNFFSDFVIKFINGKFNSEIKNNVKIMSIVIIIGTYNNIIGVLGFINLKLEKFFRNIVYIVGIFNVFLITILGYLYQDIGGAITFVASELLLFLLLINKFRKL